MRQQARRDHFQEVTDRIVAALEEGRKPWVRPWNADKCGGPQSPRNPVTGRHYRGVNVLLLGMSPLAFETGDPRWCTYQQAQDKKWQVRKGEKSTGIFFFKPLDVKDKSKEEDDDGPASRMIGMLRALASFTPVRSTAFQPGGHLTVKKHHGLVRRPRTSSLRTAEP